MTRRETRRDYGASGERKVAARPAKVIFLTAIGVAVAIAAGGTVIAQEANCRSERELDPRTDLIIEHRLRPPTDWFYGAFGIQAILGLDPDDQIYWKILRNRELPE